MRPAALPAAMTNHYWSKSNASYRQEGYTEVHRPNAYVAMKHRYRLGIILDRARLEQSFCDMFDIILFTPQIPPNTGNIIRLCANTGARLHLIRPLGFELDEKAVRRAGLDYHEMAIVTEYNSLNQCLGRLEQHEVFAVTKFAHQTHDQPCYKQRTAFLFGAETTGLPNKIHKLFADDKKISLPMLAGNRSLNLSNAVSIVIYEAWRQRRFTGSHALEAQTTAGKKETK